MLTPADKKGIAFCILSTICITLQDVISKALVAHFSVGQMILVRHLVFIPFAVWWLSRNGAGFGNFLQAFRRAGSAPMQILRSSLMVLEIALFFVGLRYIGVAQAHAIFMLFPILTTLLAALLLGESLTKRKLIALAIGFIGAMLIIRPGGSAFESAMLITLSAALVFALYNIVTRHATAKDGFDISVVYMATVGFVWVLPFGVLHWESEAPTAMWVLLVAAAVVSIIVHLLIVKSLEYASASLLQPFNYTLVGWAMLFGWIFYDEVLDWLHIAGILTVLTAGLYMLRGDKPK